ncbi:MAG TPA: hypothetical protein VE291_09120 [Terracidiphilus sp.]|nr:hypothetical protein [Terracidiphilus sp.]
MGYRRMGGVCGGAMLLMAASALGQTAAHPAAARPVSKHGAAAHHHAKTKGATAATTVEVINGTQVHEQTFPASGKGSRGGKVVGDTGSIRVLNGTTWSTDTFNPQPAGKPATGTLAGKNGKTRGGTQVNVLNGTEAHTKVFAGNLPQVRPGAAQQRVVIGIESAEEPSAKPGKVVVGVASSDSVPRPIAADPAHSGRPPYHPAAKPAATKPVPATPKS